MSGRMWVGEEEEAECFSATACKPEVRIQLPLLSWSAVVHFELLARLCRTLHIIPIKKAWSMLSKCTLKAHERKFTEKVHEDQEFSQIY